MKAQNSAVPRQPRHPDNKIVINLWALGHAEKLDYVRKLFSILARLRRQSGLAHWIVVDEAHYFLNQSETEAPVDVELSVWS